MRVALHRVAIPAAAGHHMTEHVAAAEPDRLRQQGGQRAAAGRGLERVAGGLAWLAAEQAMGREGALVAADGERVALGEELVVAHHRVTAAVTAGPARAGHDAVALDAQGVGLLDHLDGDVGLVGADVRHAFLAVMQRGGAPSAHECLAEHERAAVDVAAE